MTAGQRITFRWRDWLWALRWRLPIWSAVAIYLAVRAALDGDHQMLAIGLALVPGLLALGLTLQGILGLLYLVPERWPAATGTCTMLLVILAPYLTVALLLGLIPAPPREQRPVLHHPLHQDEHSNFPYNPIWGWLAAALLATIVLLLS